MEKRSILEKLPLDNFSVHCVGIGGIGVSAIAEILLEAGCKVSGSDSEYNDCCARLADLGAAVASAGHRKENLPDYELGGLVMSGAVSMNNEEVVTALRNRVMAWTRGEFLGELCRCFKRPVMVAGSHGKSSISAMLGWMLTRSGVDCGLLLGAKYQDKSRRACLGNGDIIVGEADESDNSLALLSGELALVSNIDNDHAWNASAVEAQDKAFVFFAGHFAKTIYLPSEKTGKLFGSLKNCEALTDADFKRLDALVPARFLGYERSNAVLALAGAEYLQLDLSKAAAALNDYPGIDRRQSVLYSSGKMLLVEDYAHHPAELAASLQVLAERGAGRRITVVFQPHRYERLTRYFDDFVRILSNKDLQVKVLDVFSAWSHVPADAMTGGDLVRAINHAGGNAEMISNDFRREADRLLKAAGQTAVPEMLALIGAGSIHQLTMEVYNIIQKQQF